MEKTCSKCKEPKLLSEFDKRKESKDGFRNECKICRRISQKKWCDANPEKIKKYLKKFNNINPDYDKKRYLQANPKKIIEIVDYSNLTNKTCSKCKEEKEIYFFSKSKNNKDGLNYECKKCISEYCKKNYINNKVQINKRHKTYYYDNIIREKERKKLYRQTNGEKIMINYNKHPHINAWRGILKSCLRRLGKKKEGHTIDLLGYSALELKNHITSLFTDGMTWNNYGEWHIDHIKPIHKFDKDSPMNIVNTLSNLRPLWATTREINGIIYEGNLNRPKY